MTDNFVVVKDFPSYKIDKNATIIHTETGATVVNSVYYADHSIIALLYNEIENYGKYVLVAKLLATAFLENPENKTNILFKDKNFANLTLTNLEWVE